MKQTKIEHLRSIKDSIPLVLLNFLHFPVLSGLM